MAKVFTGKVISDKMTNTVVVSVTSRKPHPMYRKLLKRSKHFKADTAGKEVKVGDTVKLAETRRISKDKYFKVVEIIREEK